MSIRTAYSLNTSLSDAVIELKNQLSEIDPKLIVFFSSTIFNPASISKEMKDTFSTAEIIGCSTAGEIVSGQVLKNSIVAMALDQETIADVKIGILENISQEINIPSVFNTFENHFNVPVNQMAPNEYFGMILFDGLSLAEEKVMDKIGDLANIIFIGGSAGDDLKFQKTYVYANGQTYSNATILALVKPKTEFSFIKTQSFCTLNKKLVATKVNEAKREIIEFDGKPAAEAYAESLDTSLDTASDKFMKNPMGLSIEGDIYVRSPQQVKDNGLIFYCAVKEGMALDLLQATDMIKDTRKAIETKEKELGSISGLINFNCILRTLDLENTGKTADYGKIFDNIPTIGFSTYGEEYLGHINQTATMLVFK